MLKDILLELLTLDFHQIYHNTRILKSMCLKYKVFYQSKFLQLSHTFMIFLRYSVRFLDLFHQQYIFCIAQIFHIDLKEDTKILTENNCDI